MVDTVKLLFDIIWIFGIGKRVIITSVKNLNKMRLKLSFINGIKSINHLLTISLKVTAQKTAQLSITVYKCFKTPSIFLRQNLSLHSPILVMKMFVNVT